MHWTAITMSQANRIGEIFQFAGSAFTKLAELTMYLNGAQPQPSVLSQANADNQAQTGKWDPEDIEQMRAAIRRFTEELNRVSENIKRKSLDNVKAGVKRKTFKENGLPPPPDAKPTSIGILTPMSTPPSQVSSNSTATVASTPIIVQSTAPTQGTNPR